MAKAFEKQTKSIEDQGKKRVEAIKEHGKQISNEVTKNGFDIEKVGVLCEKQKEK